VWIFFDDAVECAKTYAKIYNEIFRVVVVDGGWSIPGLRIEENEAGFNDGQPLRFARKLQAKYDGKKYTPLDLSVPDKWTLESGDPLP
jgi:hypothetical protein